MISMEETFVFSVVLYCNQKFFYIFPDFLFVIVSSLNYLTTSYFVCVFNKVKLMFNIFFLKLTTRVTQPKSLARKQNDGELIIGV